MLIFLPLHGMKYDGYFSHFPLKVGYVRQGVGGQIEIKGKDRRENLWSFTCVIWLILFALIRDSSGACLKSVAVPWILSLLTDLEAMLFFSLFFTWYISKSVLLMVYLSPKSTIGHGVNTVDIFGGNGLTKI